MVEVVEEEEEEEDIEIRWIVRYVCIDVEYR